MSGRRNLRTRGPAQSDEVEHHRKKKRAEDQKVKRRPLEMIAVPGGPPKAREHISARSVSRHRTASTVTDISEDVLLRSRKGGRAVSAPTRSIDGSDVEEPEFDATKHKHKRKSKVKSDSTSVILSEIHSASDDDDEEEEEEEEDEKEDEDEDEEEEEEYAGEEDDDDDDSGSLCVHSDERSEVSPKDGCVEPRPKRACTQRTGEMVKRQLDDEKSTDSMREELIKKEVARRLRESKGQSGREESDITPEKRFEVAQTFEHKWADSEYTTFPLGLWAAQIEELSGMSTTALDFARHVITEAVSSVARAKQRHALGLGGMQTYPKLLLMEGVPGCGKSELARCLISTLAKATSLQSHLGRLLVLSAGALTPKWKGADVSELHACYYAACRPGGIHASEPFVGLSIIYMDEISVFVEKEGSCDNSMRTHLTELLTTPIHPGFSGALLFIGTVNDSSDVHYAIKSRAEIVTITRPNMENYRRISRRCIRKACGDALETSCMPKVMMDAVLEQVESRLCTQEVMNEVDALGGVCGTDIRKLVLALKRAFLSKIASAAHLAAASAVNSSETGSVFGSGALQSNDSVIEAIMASEARFAQAVQRAQSSECENAALLEEVVSMLPSSSELAVALRDTKSAILVSNDYERTCLD